jgi:hypothetical protein
VGGTGFHKDNDDGQYQKRLELLTAIVSRGAIRYFATGLYPDAKAGMRACLVFFLK